MKRDNILFYLCCGKFSKGSMEGGGGIIQACSDKLISDWSQRETDVVVREIDSSNRRPSVTANFTTISGEVQRATGSPSAVERFRGPR